MLSIESSYNPPPLNLNTEHPEVLSELNPSQPEPNDDPTQEPAETPIAPVSDEHHVTVVDALEFIETPASEDPAELDEDAPRLQSVSEARAAVEALLFATNEPLSTERISKLLNGLHPRTVQGLLTELQVDYDGRAGGLQISEVAGGYQMATRGHVSGWLMGLHKQRRRAVLSPATLETLTILAYKQPMTRAEIEAIRGVDSSGTVRTLIELGLIEVHGHREVLGRPQLYMTTGLFLKAFGLRSLADLPSMAELKQLYSEQRMQEEAREEARRARAAEKAEKAKRKAALAAAKTAEATDALAASDDANSPFDDDADDDGADSSDVGEVESEVEIADAPSDSDDDADGEEHETAPPQS